MRGAHRGPGVRADGLGDATRVRVVRLPVTMRPAGRAGWWAPKPLRWLYRGFRISEAVLPGEYV
ncbi:hypothetical protein OHT59_41865 [Streptomyces sp. NBC_00243]|uniref:hypothetical protein n=1 Tax=Streptomyces sp. NBC_00243 TaxID=2975688 RepID=UPI002DD8EEEE|nr:hypothetical protein [Streptomyces sp. NBC_00243]WRZ24612.1 hypothetical protein OHT59_41865 [Streptomyces sp. NBC_00243]